MVSLGFVEKVRAAIEEHRLLDEGDGVVVAVSGGPDSLALLHALDRLASGYRLRLIVAHLDHRLRGEEGRADAAFVRDLAGTLRLPVVIGAADIKALAAERGLGTEEAGREARYAFLSAVAAERGCARVAVGHTQNDQAETVLIRLIRGGGPDGLAGMAWSRPLGGATIIRPLLGLSRQEVEAFCKDLGLQPRHDRTNDDPSYLRNRVRHELLPLLSRNYNPGIVGALAALAGWLGEERAVLRALTDEAYARVVTETEDDIIRLDLAGLVSEPPAIRRRLIHQAALRAGVAPTRLSSEGLEAALELVTDGRTGAATGLAGGFAVVREPSSLIIVPPAAVGPKTFVERPVPVPGRTDLPEVGLAIAAEVLSAEAFPGQTAVRRDEAYLDADLVLALPESLRVRPRRPGDAFHPQGSTGRRKLKDFFIDAKVPRRERDRVPLIVGGEGSGTIVWVAGWRIEDEFKVTDRTRRLLHLRLVRLSSEVT